MGGKGRHSKDRMYQNAAELTSHKRGDAGTKKSSGRLPFDHCALSLTPYEQPCCGPEGVIFDLTNLVPYLQKHKKNPISSEPMTSREIVRLNMTKNDKGEWICPVTFKTFNDSSHIVAVRTTGSVYSYEAVLELNIKAKNWEDLMTGEAFEKKDLITLFHGLDDAHQRSRDISTFAHLREMRGDTQAAQAGESRVRLNPTAENVLKEIAKLREEEEHSGAKKRALEEIFGGTVGGQAHPTAEDEDAGEDVAELLALKPTTAEVEPGMQLTAASKSASLTSTSFGSIVVADSTRLARASELREARFRRMRAVGKKAFVQLQTSHGQINLELHADIAPRTCWNFLTLCERGYYDRKCFHRLVPGFTLQGGAESSSGKGGSSAFPRGRVFPDEFDQRLHHNSRGVLSMANSGPNCNKSQFFITLGECAYLDRKHSVFGRVVGGASTLDRIEAIGADAKERPLEEVVIVRAISFGESPVAEADGILRHEILSRRSGSTAAAGIKQDNTKLVAGSSSSSTLAPASAPASAIVGKYLSAQQVQQAENSSTSTALGGYGNDDDDVHTSTFAAADLRDHVAKKSKQSGSGGFGDFSGW